MANETHTTQEGLQALHLANAAMFRNLLRVFIANVDGDDAKTAFQRALFKAISVDLDKSTSADQKTRDAALSIVRSVFGIPGSTATN